MDKTDIYTNEQAVKIFCRVGKNRAAKGNPYKTCDYTALYGKGIDITTEIPKILIRENLLIGSTWLSMIDDSTGDVAQFNNKPLKWNGRKALCEDLTNDGLLLDYMSKFVDDLFSSGKIDGVKVTAAEIEELESANKEIETELADTADEQESDNPVDEMMKNQ